MKAITLGVFLDPPAWIDKQPVRPTNNKLLEPQDCKEIVYSAQLNFGVAIFVWRQGFVGVHFSEGFVGQDLSSFDPVHGISKTDTARMPLIFFNAFLYIFYNEKLEGKHRSSWTPKQYVHARDIYIFQNSLSDDLKSTVQSIPIPFSMRFSIDAPIYEMGRIQGMLTPEHQMMMPTFPLSSIETTVQKLEQVVSFSINMLETISLLNGAVYFLQEGQLSQSLILSWAVAEKCIDILWQDYWRNRPTGPSNKSQKTKDNIVVGTIKKTEWKISRRIELLELEGVISPQLYLQLDGPRYARNKWMHDLQTVDYTNAKESHTCANELLQIVTGVSLTHPGAFPL